MTGGAPGVGWLGTMTWPEAEAHAAAGAVLAVPLGSTEQHGPHLALSTDTDVAVDLCRRLAGARADVVVAPPLPYGSSGEHESFAGTVSIGQDALEAVLLELCRSATRHFAGVVLVSAHGGNAEALGRAQRRLVAEGRRVLAWSASWDGDAHAGRVETSLALALRPSAVHLGAAERGTVRPVAELLPAMRAGGVRAVSSNGVLGDPAGASAAEGEAHLEAMAAALDGAVSAWMRR